jgi:hypothetical protein
MSRLLDRTRTRGSRRHVLDWVSVPAFTAELTGLLSPTCAIVSPGVDTGMPTGWEGAEEARLERFGPRVLPEAIEWPELTRWWLAHPRGATTPNWDIAATCTVEGRRGLVLVEAKAHHAELHNGGKRLLGQRRRLSSGETVHRAPSANAEENHRYIGAAINGASAALDRIVPGVSLSSGRCYQLANRVAFAWRLASLGLPVILVYLGFTGDGEVGEEFRNHAAWEVAFRAHASTSIPDALSERRIDCGPAAFTLLVRSRPVRATASSAKRP